MRARLAPRRTRLTLVALLVETLFGCARAYADDDAPVQLERVEITGSRIRRIDGETALPVQVLRREDIDRSGAQSAEELLELITANAGSTPEALSVGDESRPGFSGASLRGLGSTRTLVLLNGRRLGNYAFSDQLGSGVDLSAIPLQALDRVEVLKEGASAIYGSDAIGGVINFITKKDFRGGEASIYQGDSQQGGGSKTRATATIGIGDPAVDRFNAFAIFDYQNKGELAARQRSFASTAYRPSEGLDGTSNNSFPANIRVGAFLFVNPAAPACTDVTVFDRGGCAYDFEKQADIIPPSKRWSAFARGTFTLDATQELYVEGLYNRKRLRSITAPTPVGFFTTDGDAVVLPTTSPYYPSGLGLSGDISDLRYRTVSLGPRQNDVISEQDRMLVGTKGTAHGWDYDTSLSYNRSRATDHLVSGFVDASLIANALATGLINPFGDSGPAGDALLRSSQFTGVDSRATGITRGLDAHASRDLVELPSGPLSVALGVDARRESLLQAQPLDANITGGSQGSTSGGRRSVEAAYLELSIPIAKGLDAQLALRGDHYSDFGTTVNPKVSLRWQPIREVLLRASYGRGFRAPSLPELFTKQAGYVDFIEDIAHCVTADCGSAATFVSGGNPALKPERSEQATAGLVFEPSRHVAASIDFWRIRVKDVIAPLDAGYVLANESTYAGTNIFRGPVDPAYPTLPGPITELVLLNENVGTSLTRGFDIEARWRSDPTPFGSFDVTLTGTYVQLAKEQLETLTFVNLRAANVNGEVIPRWEQYLSLGWKYAAWTAAIHERRETGYEEAPSLTGAHQHVGSYQTWGAQVSFAGVRNATLTLGVNNLFNRDPPFALGGGYAVGFDPAIADPRGRFFYARLTTRWP